MDKQAAFQCDLCPRSFPSSRALAAHRRWQHPSLSASSSKQHADTNANNKGEYSLRENPRKNMEIPDPEFLDAPSIVQKDVKSEDESVEIFDLNNGLSEEVDAANILVHLAQNRKNMDGSSDYDTHGKGNAIAIAARKTKGRKLESADQSKRARALRNGPGGGVVLALESPRFKCQALGGHRSGHSNKVISASRTPDLSVMSSDGPKPTEDSSETNIYVCLYCAQEFLTGHAFGGHKWSRACRPNYRDDAASFQAPPPPQIQPPGSPPLPLVPPPYHDQPTRFLFDLNEPPPSDDEY